MVAEIGVILGQVGSPADTTRSEIRRYLAEFLSDQRVVDMPRWRWAPILHGIVLRTRPAHTQAHYRDIWTESGSPMRVISEAQQAGIQERLGERFQVELGMAYSRPGIPDAITALEAAGIRKIVVLPLFPQFSTSTTASIYDAVSFAALGRAQSSLPVKKFVPTLRFVHPYFDDPDFIELLAAHLDRELRPDPQPDRVIFSYHSLPRRFITEGDPYEEHCTISTRLLVEKLGWPTDRWEHAYQSRFDRRDWLGPMIHTRLADLPAEGVQRPAIFTPGFTTDCLETLQELGIRGRDAFTQAGGDTSEFRMIPCLNDDPRWLDYAATLIDANTRGW